MTRKRLFHIALTCLAVTLLASCSIRRHVPEGKHFLDKNQIVIKQKHVTFSKADLKTYIGLKSTKVHFPFRFSTWLYYVTEDKTDKSFWRWVNQHLTKEPVYFDMDAAINGAQQAEQYLDNIGYFHSKVKFDVEYSKRRRKRHLVKTRYTVYPGKPYTISNINYQIEDTVLAQQVMLLERRFPTKVNDIYNAYNLEQQRSDITEFLHNMGYPYFTRDYITFEVDSNFLNHTLEVTMKIANVYNPVTDTYSPHKQYIVDKINIYPNYSPNMVRQHPVDSATITYNTGFQNTTNTLNFYYYDKPDLRPRTFKNIIKLQQGRLYRQRQVELTYSSLSNLRIIANSSIEFDTLPSDGDSLNRLNCNILLRKAEKHSVKLQTEATNSGGDLGISGSISYTNKNLFKGAEVLTLSIKGGLEAQEVIQLGEMGDQGGFFNTTELIFNSSLYIPTFLSPIPLKNLARDYIPRTTLSLGSSVQKRYAYSRYITMGSFGYDWKANRKLQFLVTPFYLNYVKVNPIPEFQAILDEESNQRIKDQYTSHFVFGGRYSIIYNTQNIYQTGNYIYIRANLESSGAFLSLFNSTSLIKDQDDHHELLGIRYAQYLRGDVDFRQYYRMGSKTWLVFRQLVGLGIPYGNSYDMPFERSFYSGGSTGMRGWGYRKLGPGAYVPTSTDANIERIGDIQLECNAELRFPISGMVNGTIFMDAGNIWNYHANELLPNGEFRFNTFYDQIAVDSGFGICLDLKAAIVRVDLAMPIRRPYPDSNGDHWHLNVNSLADMHLVLNIGHPF